MKSIQLASQNSTPNSCANRRHFRKARVKALELTLAPQVTPKSTHPKKMNIQNNQNLDRQIRSSDQGFGPLAWVFSALKKNQKTGNGLSADKPASVAVACNSPETLVAYCRSNLACGADGPPLSLRLRPRSTNDFDIR